MSTNKSHMDHQENAKMNDSDIGCITLLAIIITLIVTACSIPVYIL